MDQQMKSARGNQCQKVMQVCRVCRIAEYATGWGHSPALPEQIRGDQAIALQVRYKRLKQHRRAWDAMQRHNRVAAASIQVSGWEVTEGNALPLDSVCVSHSFYASGRV